MYPTLSKTSNYWHELGSMSESVIDSIPTLDRQLDNYFDRNAAAIIEEWGLVTDDDLRHLRMKLDYLSYEVGRLVVEKSSIEKRALSIKDAIVELEKGI
jgi:hypothetical protein